MASVDHKAAKGSGMIGGVYKITNLANGKIYVGSATDFARRKREHFNRLKAGKHHSQSLQRAWLKYGPDCFEFEVIEPVADNSALIATEQQWLDLLKPWDKANGYNVRIKADSCLGVRRTEEQNAAAKLRMAEVMKQPEVRAKIKAAKANQSAETRAKIAAALKGRTRPPEMVALVNEKLRNPSAETRAKMSAASSSRSDETRAKIAASLKGRKQSPETIAKASAARIGMRHSEETKQKMAAAKRGKPRDEETKAKVREGLLRYYAQRRAA